MEYSELYNEYLRLLEENRKLKEENDVFRKQLGLVVVDMNINDDNDVTEDRLDEILVEKSETIAINNSSSPEEKIELFMSLFKGRDDVYAKHWKKKDGKSNYSPVCLNEWRRGLCDKPKVKCSECKNKKYDVLDGNAIDKHLRGIEIFGIYPMNKDETCNLLAIDFDNDGWDKDITIFREICEEKKIPFVVERSKSGDGAHVWFFFKEKIEASVARKFGTSMLTYAMTKRHEIKFESYDRMFPNQDTMPKGGFGNLIALPMQKGARVNKNSVFIDEKFDPYKDQWAFLSSIVKLSKDDICKYTTEFCIGNELGDLKVDKEENVKPWESMKGVKKLNVNDFPEVTYITKVNMIYINKRGFSNKVLNAIKRLAAFKNPEFYRAQAMRLSTFDKPRVISLSDETEEYISIPRGSEEDLLKLLNENNVKFEVDDKVYEGDQIKVQFNGQLREEQLVAVQAMLKYNNGVLSATTAFGKTVIGAKLIAERGVNTLIVVHTQQLLEQWRERLKQFLIIAEELPAIDEPKRGRKKSKSIIGQLGGGKNRINGIVDIATMQSLARGGEVKELVKNYGMVIVDECHHVSAFSFELVLKNVTSKYVYGLTATPVRKDGHHPIIFMQCGPIRYKVDALKQAEKRPFEHYIIPRFTSFRKPISRTKERFQSQRSIQR